MRKVRVVIVAAGACGVILAAGGATAALASIPSSNGVIHGCYSSTGALRVVNATTCPKAEKSLSWNQKGPAGPAGPSLNTTVVEGGDTTAGVGSFETGSVTCPPAYPHVLSGGYLIENSQTSPTDYSVIFSIPVIGAGPGATQWWVRIAVPADAPANVDWVVRAVCAS